MTELRTVFGLAVLGSALACSSLGWAQQDSDKPSQEEPAPGESNAARDKKSAHERRSTIKSPAEAAIRKQTEALRNQGRRLQRELQRESQRRAGERSEWPFRFNLHGDWYFSEPRPNDLGATIVSADESLRTQLGLGDGQGLIVKSVTQGGPAFRVGLQANDVLTTLAEKPLATPADLIKQLKEAGERAVPLQVLRAGKPLTIQVKPVYHVTFGPVESSRPQYQLGVRVETLDDTLRSQLKLPDQEGLLVNVVEPDSAAERAGFKKHDVLLAVGDQTLKSTADLVRQIQNSSGKALKFKVLRGGKTITVEVTPSLQPEVEEGSIESGFEPGVRAVRPYGMALPTSFDFAFPIPKPPSVPFSPSYDPLWSQRTGNIPIAQPFPWPHPSEPRIEDLRGEVEELRRSIEQLQRSLTAKPDSDQPNR